MLIIRIHLYTSITFNRIPQIFQLLTNRIYQMRPQTKDIQILFKRFPKYAILILENKKIQHHKIHHKKVNNTTLFKKEF